MGSPKLENSPGQTAESGIEGDALASIGESHCLPTVRNIMNTPIAPSTMSSVWIVRQGELVPALHALELKLDAVKTPSPNQVSSTILSQPLAGVF